MPIYEIACRDCSQVNEVIVVSSDAPIVCPDCGSARTPKKLMSATSSLTGQPGQHLPGRGDTPCCGKSPSEAGCAGPGSCCGRAAG